MGRALFIDGLKGLGDNIYQRPFVRAQAMEREVWLSTPWPEIYADLPVRFVRTGTTLRTQALNERRQPARTWGNPPAHAARVRPFYGAGELRRGSIVQAFERFLPLSRTPFVFDLPPMGPAPALATGGKPIAVVRPVTVRKEWRNEARNPRPEYVAEIARRLMRTHHVVVVAHLAAGEEWLEGELPPHHQAFVRGELDVRGLLALVRDADVVVGGVGWIVPAAVALRTRAFIVLGGQGGHNAPEKITDPRMDLSRISWARPAAYCRCENMRHACVKTIPDLAEQWTAWAESQGIAA
ncbi:hypothetical protein [Phenylobacterium sp.]|uniref:hypothetical protein n=1 Tax=Phenylobacterium sp. TaxID=1871053 RepID=UPI00391B783C